MSESAKITLHATRSWMSDEPTGVPSPVGSYRPSCRSWCSCAPVPESAGAAFMPSGSHGDLVEVGRVRCVKGRQGLARAAQRRFAREGSPLIVYGDDPGP